MCSKRNSCVFEVGVVWNGRDLNGLSHPTSASKGRCCRNPSRKPQVPRTRLIKTWGLKLTPLECGTVIYL